MVSIRNLYHLSAVVEEKILHQMLVLLAGSKAMDVKVLPVTSGGAESEPEQQPQRASATGLGSTATQMVRLFAAQASAPFRTADVLAAAPDDIPRHQFAVVLAHLAKTGELKRVSQGLYQRTANLRPPGSDTRKPNGAHPASNGAALPAPPAAALQRTPSGRLAAGTGPAILLELLRAANGPIKPKALYAAMRAGGIPAKSIHGLMARSKAKLKKTAAGYELRAGA